MLLHAGDVYEFHVDMAAIAQAFLSGHRVRVQVTSSDFRRYDRNLNTGCSLGKGTESRVAVNTNHHDAGRPSHVVLPVMRCLPEEPG